MLEHLNDYNYSVYSPTLNYGSVPTFRHVGAVNNSTGFGSLYLVRKEDASRIKAAGTTAKFAGCVWSGRLWLDIDNYETAEKVKNRLVAMELNFVMYDSGGKGAHFGILRPTDPSHLLPLLDKSWVRAHVPEADDSIYTHLHLFRLPGTIHQNTGRQKKLVFVNRGKGIELGRWKEGVKAEANQLLKYKPTGEVSVFESMKVMGNTVPTLIGNRHPTMLRAAYGLKDKQVPEYIARWWVGEINKMCELPKEEEELDKLVQSVYEVL